MCKNKKQRTSISIILLVSTFICLVNQTTMVTALPVIQSELHQSMNLVQWLTTIYVLIIGIVTPLAANLYEKFTNRKLFFSLLGIFCIGTLIGCCASDFWLLLVSRILQAGASGILLSFQMTILITIYPSEKRGTIMGLSGMVMSLGPAIGPTLAGVIIKFWGWRYIFILTLPIVLIILAISYFIFPNISIPNKFKIDIYSTILSLSGFLIILIGLSSFQSYPFISLFMFVLGAFIIFIFLRRQLKIENPLFKITLLRIKSFRSMLLIITLVFMIILGTEQMISIFAQNIMNLTSIEAGLILFPGTLFYAITAFFTGRLYDKYGIQPLIPIGIILMIIGTVVFLFIKSTTPIWIIIIFYIIKMIGNALVYSSAMSEIFKDLKLNDISYGTSLNDSINQILGSVVITLFISISELSNSFILGMHLDMWITIFITIFVFVIFFKFYKYNVK